MFLKISQLVTKSAVSKPATRLYPFDKREPYAKTRGHVDFEVSTCNFCTLCARACPTDAIVVNRKSKIWEIDRTKCILCSACVESCRKTCISLSNERVSPMTLKEVERVRGETESPNKPSDGSNPASIPTASEKKGCGLEVAPPDKS